MRKRRSCAGALVSEAATVARPSPVTQPSVQSPIPAIPVALRHPDPTMAVIFMLGASLCLAATTLLAKALGTDALGPALHPVQVSHGRFLFAWLTIGTVALSLRPKLTRPDFGTHLMRTLCGFGGVTLMFAAAAAIPLADATAISFLNPIFGMILAIPLLGERPGRWRWLAAAIAFGGALILVRPGGSAVETGTLLALGAAFLLGLELIFIKRLSGRERPLQILLVNNTMGLTVASLAVLSFWQPPSLAQWAGLTALGLIMATAQFCFVSAMARAEASFVTPFSYLTLVFAALYDLAIFGVVPAPLSLLGAVTIIAGAALLAWRERVNSAAARASRAAPGPQVPPPRPDPRN